MARETMSELVVEEFKNSIGQIIKPGDKVVAVTTGYGHSVSVFTGEFAGVRRDKTTKQIVGTSLVNVAVNYNDQEFRDDGEHEEKKYVKTYGPIWDYVPTGRRFNWVPKVTYRKTTLQRNRLFKIDTQLNQIEI